MSRMTMDRRTFLKGTAAAAATLALPRRPTRGQSPNEKLRVACVGVGGRGTAAVDAMANEQIVALCDADERRGAESRSKHPEAEFFTDFRRMFDRVGDKIDAVTVSTPDHMHFPPAIRAIRMGKHVFVEKPLTRLVWEARQLAEAAAEHKVVTQMGNQGHANSGTRSLKEWVQSGVLGPVREVHCWTNRPIWPQGMAQQPADTPPVPEGLHWDQWLAGAQDRPYHPDYLPFKWRGWWDFGSGALGDMGCHVMDAAYYALDLGAPVRVRAESSPVSVHAAPSWSIVTYNFRKRGDMPPVKLVWYDGGKKPPMPPGMEPDRKVDDSGTLVVGERATVLCNTYNESVRIVPETRMQELAPELPDKSIPRIKGSHFEEWIRGCKGGPLPGSNFAYSSKFSEMVLLGNLAIRSGKPIRWNSKRLKPVDVPEAEAFVREPYRDGWV